jgi:hypothetical protein
MFAGLLACRTRSIGGVVKIRSRSALAPMAPPAQPALFELGRFVPSRSASACITNIAMSTSFITAFSQVMPLPLAHRVSSRLVVDRQCVLAGAADRMERDDGGGLVALGAHVIVTWSAKLVRGQRVDARRLLAVLVALFLSRHPSSWARDRPQPVRRHSCAADRRDRVSVAQALHLAREQNSRQRTLERPPRSCADAERRASWRKRLPSWRRNRRSTRIARSRPPSRSARVGGMGAVYEVERLADHQRFAPGALRGRSDPDAMARFAREAQIVHTDRSSEPRTGDRCRHRGWPAVSRHAGCDGGRSYASRIRQCGVGKASLRQIARPRGTARA